MPRSLSPFAQHAHILSYRTKIHRLRPCPLAGSRESIGYFQSGGSPVNENVETEIIKRMEEALSLDQLIALPNHALLLTLASSGLRVETCRLLQQEQLKDDEKGTRVEVFRPRDPHLLTIPLSREASLALHKWI